MFRIVLLRLSLIAVAVAMLTLMAPWGTGRLAPLHRMESFLLCGLVWEICVLAARWALRPVFSDAAFVTSPLPMLAVLLVCSLPATAGTMLVIRLLSGYQVDFLTLYGQSLLLGVAISFARRGLMAGPSRSASRQDRTAPSGEALSVAGVSMTGPAPLPGDTARQAATFLARHAPGLSGRKLLALQAEDHYLRIHTDGGNTLVLMRMRDAIAMLGDAAGWQPHRSFWIAAGIPARSERRVQDQGGQERGGQAWQLVLEHGLTVPVSRNALPAMRAAGYAGPATVRAVTQPSLFSAAGTTPE